MRWGQDQTPAAGWCLCIPHKVDEPISKRLDPKDPSDLGFFFFSDLIKFLWSFLAGHLQSKIPKALKSELL